mmetsp:Transcript_963/g.2273  ORF Transcript_963/g.2273 Transcript_963/m.2273 type:complete len:646 (+) Transcript_963:224-2161(+)
MAKNLSIISPASQVTSPTALKTAAAISTAKTARRWSVAVIQGAARKSGLVRRKPTRESAKTNHHKQAQSDCASQLLDSCGEMKQGCEGEKLYTNLFGIENVSNNLAAVHQETKPAQKPSLPHQIPIRTKRILKTWRSKREAGELCIDAETKPLGDTEATRKRSMSSSPKPSGFTTVPLFGRPRASTPTSSSRDYLTDFLQAIKTPETTFDALGDGLVWEAHFEEELVKTLKRVLQHESRASAAIAFLATRALHVQCDVPSQESIINLFFSSGKLHADELVSAASRDTLLIKLLQERHPPVAAVDHLLRVASHQIAINPRKQNSQGQTALCALLDNLCGATFFDDYVALGEKPQFPSEVLNIVVELEKLGFFACLKTDQLWHYRKQIKYAIRRWETHFNALCDDQNIRHHVNSLRHMQPFSRGTAHSQNKVAKSFQLALKYHAEEVTARGVKVLDLLDKVYDMITARLEITSSESRSRPTPPSSPKNNCLLELGERLFGADEAKFINFHQEQPLPAEASVFWQAPSYPLMIWTIWEVMRRITVLVQTCESGSKTRYCRSQEQALIFAALMLVGLLIMSCISIKWRLGTHKLAFAFLMAVSLHNVFHSFDGVTVNDGLAMLVYAGVAFQCYQEIKFVTQTTAQEKVK